MSLLPNQPFTPGTPFTPELADLAFNTPVFDGQTQYLGHRAPLADTELSNAPGSLRARVAGITDALQVNAATGLTVTVAAGIVTLANGTTTTIAGQQLELPDNSTTLIWINEAGVVEFGSQAPAIRLMLASVVTSGGAITTISDLRALTQRPIQPVASSIRVFGGSNVQDYTAVQGDLLDQGIYYFRNFTVPSGVQITVDKFAQIICSGTVNVLGRIDVDRLPLGALALSVSVTNQEVGFSRGGGIGGGGASYPFALQPYGSGGSTGIANAPNNNSGNGGRIGAGGDGGGSLEIQASGPITLAGSSITVASGGNAQAPSEMVGSANISGSGGGSGGLIYLSSLVSVTIAAGATVDVRGGNGSNGARVGSAEHASGGGGGSGGVIALSSPVNNTTGANLELTGGTRGNNSGTPVALGGGVGGGFGGTATSGNAGPAGRLIVRNFVPVG